MHHLFAKRTNQVFLFFVGLGAVLGICVESNAQNLTSEQGSLKASWLIEGKEQVIRAWSAEDLAHYRRASLSEKDTESGKRVRWDGVSLSHLLEKPLESLPAESRAQIDLIIVHGENGHRALIPRAVLGKYPVLLATRSDLKELKPHEKDKKGAGFPRLIAPLNSKPKILNEGLPLESFLVPQVKRIEFSSYKDRFSAFFLKRRTDPIAIRGEKLFIQNCVGCDLVRYHPSLLDINSDSHPAKRYFNKLSEKDRKSITYYLEAYRNENSEASAQKVVQANNPNSALQRTE